MSLIEGNQLLQRFRKRLAEAKQVDIAVAWVKCCDALDALVGEGTAIRIAVGISGNVTDPCALECLNNSQSVDLRIARSPHGIFHPKYFCFHGLSVRPTTEWEKTPGSWSTGLDLTYIHTQHFSA